MIAAGQTIGNYRVLSKIGTGGMGAVYLAEHPLIGKKVALKVIHRELASNREVVQRFFQEARAVNKIGNEHIVEAQDFGVTPDGDQFYIMEYLEGRTLASVLAHERVLDVMRALHIGAQIASALGAAHAAGIIHRDLKPDNVMLTARLGSPDFVKVLDFGLAKMFDAAGSSAVQTAAGVLLGTPQYMSPEACEGRRVIDHRTDVYALGVLLFQMMTGVLPFQGATMGDVLVKQVTELPPAPRGLNPAIPPSVEQVLLRCLAKPPEARFQNMAALRDALLDPEAYLRGSPPIAPARSVAPGEAQVDARQVRAHVAEVMAGSAMPAAGPRADGQARPAAAPGAPPAVAPGYAVPAEPKMDTMRIGTPFGYTSRSPRKVWPIVLVVGLLLGLGGGAFSVAWFGRAPKPADGVRAAAGQPASEEARGGAGTGTGTGAGTGAGTGTGTETGGGAGTGTAAGTGSGPGSPRGASTAKVTIDSVPRGATVLSGDGSNLGQTPLELVWPVSPDAVTFVLKLRGYRNKTHALAITGTTVSSVQLEPVPAGSPAQPATRRRARGNDTGLMRPD